MPAIYDVFLGGSCGWTSWRQEKIIPHLQASGITYFNPQKTEWSSDLIQVEEAAKSTSRLLLFVIDPQTANNVGLLEIAYLAARNYPLIVVLPSRREFLEISCCAEDAVDRGRAYDTVARLLSQESVRVCRSVEEARGYIEDIVIGQLLVSDALRSDRCRWPYLRLKTRRLASACSRPLARLFSQNSEDDPAICGPSSPSPSQLSPPDSPIFLQRPSSLDRSISSQSSDSDPGTTVAGPWSGTSWPLIIIQALFGILAYLVHPVLGGVFVLLIAASRAAPARLHVRLKSLDVNNNAGRLGRGSQTRRRRRVTRPGPVGYDVFLESSGEGGERDWMHERAVPVLRKSGLSYYVSGLCGEERETGSVAAASGQVLFSVASPYSTFSGIIQLAYYIGKGWRIVGVLPEEVQTAHSAHADSPADSPASHRRLGIHRSLAYLRDIAHREHCVLTTDLASALRRTVADARHPPPSHSSSSLTRP